MIEAFRTMKIRLTPKTNKSALFTFVLVQIVLLASFFLVFSMQPTKLWKKEVICFEDAELNIQRKIEVRPLKYPLGHIDKSPKAAGFVCRSNIHPGFHSPLSLSEIKKVDTCVAKYDKDFERGHSNFWSGNTQYIRMNHHTYLDTKSLLIEIGGNKGYDADDFLSKFNPGIFVILEPLKVLFRDLKVKFGNRSNVVLYNIGVGKKDGIFYVNYEGLSGNGQGTSQFSASVGGTCSMRIVNTTEFFIQLGVGCYEVDLLTINCEGCEYEVLESLLSTNLIGYFKNIQFATHSKLPRLRDPVKRYCEIQTLLERTHSLTYCYKFQWESWRRKDKTRRV